MERENSVPNIKMKNAILRYRNFRGAEQQFNPAGRRVFSVVIKDEKLAKMLIDDGWNVKFGKKRDDDPDYEPQATLKVRVNYNGPFPPKVFMRTESQENSVLLNEETIGQLDTAEIVSADLEIRPYEWDSPNGHGISAYLKKMNVVIEDEEIDSEYGDYPF